MGDKLAERLHDWNMGREPVVRELRKRVRELENQVDDLQGLLAQSDMVHDKMRIEELRAALMEVLPYVDGTIGEERPVVAAKVKETLEAGE